MRSKSILSALTLLAVLSCGGALGQATVVGDFNLPAQALGDSLRAVGRQSDVNVLFDPARVEALSAPAIKVSGTFEDALAQLLDGSGITYRFLNEHTVVLSAENGNSGAPGRPAARVLKHGAVQLAQSDAQDGQSTQRAMGEGDKLEEIVVTAQKRVERLQDVPVPMTVIQSTTLVNNNQLRLQDYYQRVPGLSVTLQGDEGAPALAIRGISAGGVTNPTVGILVDDLPYGSSVIYGNGFIAPDVDPGEVTQIEVLRGPQGTLYGAANIGGLLKYVTADPAIDAIKGRIQVGATSVRNGDGAGYNVRGMINVPVSDTVAVRASGYDRQEPGYIDDPVHGNEGVNRTDANGGRVAMLWSPSPQFSLKLGALMQNSQRFGSELIQVSPGARDLEQVRLPGTGDYERKIQVYDATLRAKIGFAELTSITGYSINENFSNNDASAFLGPYSLPRHNETNKLTQEIRVSMPIGERLTWLLGGFYDDEDSRQVLVVTPVDPATGATSATVYKGVIPTSYKEYAGFTDLTVQVTDRFDIQLGGRLSKNDQDFSSVTTGSLVGGGPIIQPHVSSDDTPFTFLLTPRLKFSSSLMGYMRVASGYRPGGPNVVSAPLPITFGSDETRNYEIGVKGDVFDRLLSFDASVYYIDWKDIQIQAFDPGLRSSYVVNGGKARSQGVELSAEARPLVGWILSGWIAYSDATLMENLISADPSTGAAGVTAVGRNGDRLPFSSRWSGSLSVDEEFALTSEIRGFVGGSWSYVGERRGDFASVFAPNVPRGTLPSYTQVDLHAGLKYASWMVNAFVSNLTDKRGLFSRASDPISGGTLVQYIQPRTVGLSVSRSF
jgi:outer membrane receptor protein involved in Fe transport